MKRLHERASRRDKESFFLMENCPLPKALEGAQLAPRHGVPLSDNFMTNVPHSAFELDEHDNLGSARLGAAVGSSDMTTKHLRPLLDDVHATHVFQVGVRLPKGEVPRSVVRVLKKGRMTVQAKQDGGVRGIVAGDVIRRLVGRTMAQQLGDAVEATTSPARKQGASAWRTCSRA